VYFVGEDFFRLVVNAGTTGKDLAWLQQQAPAYAVEIRHRDDLGILAVQGPLARGKVDALLPPGLAEKAKALAPFSAAWQADCFVGRTGYTGEDGYELILPHAQLVIIWKALLDAGVKPCGLGARDTLRLEAAMNLYGQDMDENVSPLECGLSWTVQWAPEDRAFIGREALQAQLPAPPRKSIGLVLEGRGVLRAHMPVRGADGAGGETTSGGFAPSLKGSVALARVAGAASGPYQVEVRGQWLPVREVKPPFVRNGKVLV
jgi:aminomethyltransferase